MLAQVGYIAYIQLLLHIHHFAKNDVTYTPLLYKFPLFAKNGIMFTPLC